MGEYKESFEQAMKELHEGEGKSLMTAPFGEYKDFDDCVSKNQGKGDPAAYCGFIKKQIEGASKENAYQIYKDKNGKFYATFNGKPIYADSEEELKKMIEEYTKGKITAEQETSASGKKVYSNYFGSENQKIEVYESNGKYTVTIDGKSFGSSYDYLDEAIKRAEDYIAFGKG